MEPIATFFYGMVVGLLFGFAFAVSLDEIRLRKIMRELKEETKE